MYNKLFTKILDSSIWLQSDQTVRVWITMLAAMDEDGFTPFATVTNLAHRARVTLEETERAVGYLEGPDPHSGNPANDGRRIERVSGGWVVLNAGAHRELVTRHEIKRRQRERTQASRDRKRHSDDVTDRAQQAECNSSGVTVRAQVAGCHSFGVTDRAQQVESHASVTESEAVSEAVSEEQRSVPAERSVQAITGGSPTGDRKYEKAFDEFWTVYPRKTAKQAAARAYAALRPSEALRAQLVAAVRLQAATQDWQKDGGRFVPHAATWLRGRRWEDLPVGASTATPAAGTGQASTAAETELEKADREYWRRVRETQAYTAKIAQMEEETRAELAERGDEIRAHWARLREELAAKARAKAGEGGAR